MARKTKQGRLEFRQALKAIVDAQPVITCRQVFYIATTQGFVEKSEKVYRSQICDYLKRMRWEGTIEFDDIIDRGRNSIWPRNDVSPENALHEIAEQYQEDPYEGAAERVMVFIESDGLAGVIQRTCMRYRVPLYAGKGNSSLSQLWEIATRVPDDDGQQVTILHLADYDPSGCHMTNTIVTTLDRMDEHRMLAPRFYIERIALNPDQILKYGLPGRPTKTKSNSAKNWVGGDSYELDAIPPALLNQILIDALDKHCDLDALGDCKLREAEVRAKLKRVKF